MEIEINFPKIKWSKFFKKPEIREEVQKLKYSLVEFPDEWENSSSHTIQHKKLNIKLWVSNGWEYLDFWPKINAFTKREQKYLWKAVQNVKHRANSVEATGEQNWVDAVRKLKQWGTNEN